MAVTDATGTVVERYDYRDYGLPVVYDPSGTELPGGTAIGNPYLFNGRRWDGESRLYYYRTRYMDPRAGRFITRDSIGIWGDASNLGNGYTYAGSNPWSALDPSGLQAMIYMPQGGMYIHNYFDPAGRAAIEAQNGVVAGAASTASGIAMGAVDLVGDPHYTIIEMVDGARNTASVASTTYGNFRGDGYNVFLAMAHTGAAAGSMILGGGDFLDGKDSLKKGDVYEACKAYTEGTIKAFTAALAGAKSKELLRHGKAPKSTAHPIQGLQRTGSALKTDPYHAFPDVVDNFAGSATRTPLQSGANLYQVEGAFNGAAGRFEWIVQEGQVTHRMFVPGGSANGVPIKP